MSGADIAMIAREACLSALRRTGFTALAPPDPHDVEHGIHRVRVLNHNTTQEGII
jgi:SpoVK/Ycf46/Vps4 family AAA+-type ATPase